MQAPRLYRQRIAIIEAAKRVCFDPLSAERLLWITNARPDIRYRETVFPALAEIVEVAEQHWPGLLAERKLSWVPDALQKIITQVLPLFLDQYLRLDPDHFVGPILDPEFDWSTRNAFWDALRFSRPQKDELYIEYRLLQAHFFFAHCMTLPPEEISRPAYETYGENKEWELLKISPRKAALAIRNLAKPAEWTDDLLTSLRPAKKPLLFAESPAIEVQVIAEGDEDGSWTQDRASYFQNYIRQAYGLKPRFTGRGSSPCPDSQIGDPTDPAFDLGDLMDWESELESDEEDSDNPDDGDQPDRSSGTRRNGRHKSGKREKEKRQALALDECPFEDEDESLESWSSRDDLYQRSPGSFGGALSVARNQAIRAQKWFSFAYDQITSAELRVFNTQHRAGIPRIHNLLDIWFEKRTLSKEQLQSFRMPNWHEDGGSSPLPIDLETETLLFLLVMLFTGSTFKRAYALTWAENPEDEPHSALEFVHYLVPDGPPAIRAKVPFPRYRSIQQPVPELDHNRRDYVTLPDAIQLGHFISRFLKLRRKDPKGSPYVFLKNESFYRKSAELLLSEWDTTGRVTLAKLSRYLFGRIMSQTGNDIVAATMISGQRFPGSRVAMFYACRSEADIQLKYSNAVYAATDEIALERSSRGPLEREALIRNCTYVGQPSSFFVTEASGIHIAKRLCPTLQAVRDAIAALIRDINALKGETAAPRRRTFLNLLALYTYWFFAFSSGARAMVNGFVSLSEISQLNHTAMFHDKGPESGLKESLVLMLDPVIEQLQHYAWNVGSDCFITTASLDLHFIDEKGEPEPIRPGTIERQMAPYLPGFPPAIHRRFMFNALIEAGCPPEAARVWMRHAIRGEEPWSRHATLSFAKHRETISRYLLQILGFLNFVPLDK